MNTGFYDDLFWIKTNCREIRDSVSCNWTIVTYHKLTYQCFDLDYTLAGYQFASTSDCPLITSTTLNYHVLTIDGCHSLKVPCAIAQIFALLWYVLSNVPGGQKGLNFFTRICWKTASKTVGTALPVWPLTTSAHFVIQMMMICHQLHRWEIYIRWSSLAPSPSHSSPLNDQLPDLSHSLPFPPLQLFYHFLSFIWIFYLELWRLYLFCS